MVAGVFAGSGAASCADTALIKARKSAISSAVRIGDTILPRLQERFGNEIALCSKGFAFCKRSAQLPFNFTITQVVILIDVTNKNFAVTSS
jgi:hypothetical protein